MNQPTTVAAPPAAANMEGTAPTRASSSPNPSRGRMNLRRLGLALGLAAVTGFSAFTLPAFAQEGKPQPEGLTGKLTKLVDPAQSAQSPVNPDDINPYCVNTYASGVEPITLVKIGVLENASDAGSIVAHEDFTSIVGALRPGETYTVTMKSFTGGAYDHGHVLYVDWNQDGDFTDAGEGYWVGIINNSTGTDSKSVTANIAVPPDAVLGNTRMRAMTAYNVTTLAGLPPCRTGTGYGQSEDYVVNVDMNAPLPPPPPLTLAASLSSTNGIVPASTTLTLTIGDGGNVDPQPLTADFTTALPSGITLATNASTTCPGTFTGTAGGSSITLANGSAIPVGGCTITADLAVAAGGNHTIPVGPLSTLGGNVVAEVNFNAFDTNPSTSYNTGFEAPEYVTGGLNNQAGWAARSSNVANTTPANGAQHLSQTSTTSPTSSTNALAISPAFLLGTTRYAAVSANLRVSGNGANWYFQPQDPDAGVLTTYVRLTRATNAISVCLWSGSSCSFVSTGTNYPVGEYFNLKLLVDRATNNIRLCLNNSQIYETSAGDGTTGGNNVTNMVFQQVAGSGQTAGNTFFVDDLDISYVTSYACDTSIPEHTVTSEVNGTGGTINPLGDVLVSEGNTISYTLVPDAGYMVDQVVGCGGSFDAGNNTYTTAPITAACTVTATFAPLPAGDYEVLTVDLSIENQITVSAGAGVSMATISSANANDIGFLFADFFPTTVQSLGSSLVSGATLSAASSTSDGSPVLYRASSSDTGLNIYSYSTDMAHGFTVLQTAFTGTATWNISAGAYNLMLSSAPATGDVYFPTDEAAGIPTATKIGTYRVIRPVAQHTVTSEVNGTGGTIDPLGAVLVDEGDTAVFDVIPDAGYEVDSVTGCDGTFDAGTSSYETGPITADCTVTASFVEMPVGPVLVCNTTQIPITDNLPSGVSQTVTVSAPGVINDLNVKIDATHSWVGDLIFKLSNGTTEVTFYDRPGVPTTTFGCSGDNIPGVWADDDQVNGTFENNCGTGNPAFVPDGRYAPNNPLSAFNGQNAAGTWTLTVSDNAQGDTGVLNSWCVEIYAGTPPPTYSVGGTISGLTADGLQLTLNSGTPLVVSSGATSFVFPDELLDGASYTVAVSAQPIGLTCTASNNTGTIAGADVSDVAIDCGPATEPVASITPNPVSVTAEAGSTGSSPLTIANVGGGTLTWSIQEAPSARKPVAMSQLVLDTVADPNASFGGSGLSPSLLGMPIATPLVDIPLLQNMSTTPVANASVACGNNTAGYTTQNSYWRRFYFSEHPGLEKGANITSVDVSVEAAMGASLSLTVNLYSIPHSVAVDTIPVGSLALIGTTTVSIPDGTTLSSINVPVTGMIADTANNDLVVEVNSPDYSSSSPAMAFYIGSNAAGQSHPGFLSAPICGISAPTTTAGIGFPNMHMIIVPNAETLGGGAEVCDNPSDVSWLVPTPTSGSVGGGDSSTVDVNVDASALAPGNYTANLCVTTNDADQPLVVVPVNLTVESALGVMISVDPTSLSATQDAGTTTTQVLTISNDGDIAGTWTLVESAAATGGTNGGSGELFDNGPLITHVGEGPAGTDVSLLQNATLGLNTLGAGAGNVNGVFDADDFTVTAPEGWDIDTLTFYTYQTGSTTTPTITGMYLQIWNGRPGDVGSTVIFGNRTTNRLGSSSFLGAYRWSETSAGDTTRPIMEVTSQPLGLHLAPGTYWVEVSLAGSLASGPWLPPVTIMGQTGTGNAVQSTDAGASWSDLLDSGTNTGMGIPFKIHGSVTGGSGCSVSDIPWLSVSATSGTVAAGGSASVNVSFNSAGMTPGSYDAKLCVLSNDDHGNELIEVPVNLTVTGPSEIADLSVTITASSGDVSIGDEVEYTIVASNAGPDAEPAALLTDIPPARLGNVDWMCVSATGTTCPTPNSGTGSINGLSLNLPAGASIQFSLIGTVLPGSSPAEDGAPIVNTVTIASSTTGDSNTANNTASATVLITELFGDGFEGEPAPAPHFFDRFDSYTPGSSQGQGGWKGWENDPSAAGQISNAQSYSPSNSFAVTMNSDNIRELSGIDSGKWKLTAKQFIPSGFTGDTYFILLSQYSDAACGGDYECGWAVEVSFSGGYVTNDGNDGGQMNYVTNQWVDIEVEFDLDADTQTFKYNGTTLYTGSWSGQMSGGASMLLNAIDLFSDGGSTVYYDDIKIVKIED